MQSKLTLSLIFLQIYYNKSIQNIIRRMINVILSNQDLRGMIHRLSSQHIFLDTHFFCISPPKYPPYPHK